MRLKIIKNIWNVIYSTYLCLRFPFLYPRNRFTGLYYNNWKIIDFLKNIRNKYYVFQNYNLPIANNIYWKKHTKYDNIPDKIEYWKTFWSKPLYDIIEWFHDVFLQIVFIIPTYNELDNMPTGWRKAFGTQMCKEIKHYLKKDNLLYEYRIMDVKEKWGCLHWNVAYSTAQINKTIMKYKYISKHTCIVCGSHADFTSPSEYWTNPYCEKHFPKNCGFKIPFGVEENPFYGYTGNISSFSSKKWEECLNNYKEYKKL